MSELLASGGFKGDAFYIQRVVDCGMRNVGEGGRPFATLIVNNETGEILSEVGNQVAQAGNPTSHAEIVAMREAAPKLRKRRASCGDDLCQPCGEDFQGHTFYILTNPCPMCAAAMAYSGADRVVHATTRAQYCAYYRDDRRHVDMETFGAATAALCKLQNILHLPNATAIRVYMEWQRLNQPPPPPLSTCDGFKGDEHYIRRTIHLGRVNVSVGGRPFACMMVNNTTGEILSEAGNQVAQTGDPTAHAEMVVIREASAKLRSRGQATDRTNGGIGEDYKGHNFYILTNPCPMCAGAMAYCGADKIVHATTRKEYSAYYRDDRRHVDMGTFGAASQILNEKLPVIQVPDPDAIQVYAAWAKKNEGQEKGICLGWKGDDAYSQRAVALAERSAGEGGRPFACLIVNAWNGEVLAEAGDQVVQSGDPSAHAVMAAITEASQKLRQRQQPVDGRNGGIGEDFRGHVVYIRSDPCPMYAAALGYCGADRIVMSTVTADESSAYCRVTDKGTFALASTLLSRGQPASFVPKAPASAGTAQEEKEEEKEEGGEKRRRKI